MKHTPGPWEVSGNDPVVVITAHETEDPNDSFVAMTVPEGATVGTERDYANARLIAAAPDLLAALNALRDYCYNNIAYFGHPVDGDAEANALDRVVDAALAKAER